jgi:AraC-like DNA-binding protein
MAVWALFNMKDLILTFPGMYTDKVLNWILIIDGWSAITYTIFIFEATMPGWTTLKRLLLLSIPWALFTAAYAIQPTEDVINAYLVYLWCYAWSIVIIGYIKVRQYQKYIRNNYSNIENVDLSWIRPVFLFAIVSQISWLITSIYANTLGDIIYYLSSIAMWLIVLYYSWDFNPINTQKVAQQPVQMPTSQPINEQLLEQLMTTEQIYLNKDLKVGDLARAMGTNRTYMSKYISSVLGMTFYDYINKMRIEHMSIPLMDEHPEYTLEHIAMESGFGSISTFRRAYIKCTGKSPKERTSKRLEVRANSQQLIANS